PQGRTTSPARASTPGPAAGRRNPTGPTSTTGWRVSRFTTARCYGGPGPKGKAGPQAARPDRSKTAFRQVVNRMITHIRKARIASTTITTAVYLIAANPVKLPRSGSGATGAGSCARGSYAMFGTSLACLTGTLFPGVSGTKLRQRS